ncbi:hypothetical protein ABID56_001263 [Alkalibacillus flavidus]|uniref:Uncharacterized protein n=1 Tax=Alkalibacillus flavidus TaxID=546021 RepID=A0ABV2KUB9_9BACI
MRTTLCDSPKTVFDMAQETDRLIDLDWKSIELAITSFSGVVFSR